MATKDARISVYISRSAEFARPILQHLRKLVHAACPEVEESLKWSMPHFDYQGPLCGMAAFKQHCTFGFWKSELVLPPEAQRGDEAMGHFGRITCLADLPSDRVLLGYLKKAVRLNEAGIKKPAKPRPPGSRRLIVPGFFKSALKTNTKALAAFNNFSYSHQKEYVEWITEAKRDETRAKRMKTALAWIATGKSRHWKYQ